MKNEKEIKRILQSYKDEYVRYMNSLERLIAKSKMPCNHYFVVNHDEPYADIVWRTIQLGEELKTVTEPYRVFKERK